MANLTVTVDDETLERARVRALEQGTSVNAIVAEYLRKCLRSETRELVVSTQVLQEPYACLTKGADPIATPEVAQDAVRDAARMTVVQIDVPLLFAAIERSRTAVLSFWDALIVSAAVALR